MESVKLVFNVPTKDTPGFPRRLATALEFKTRFEKAGQGGIDVEFLKDLIRFLASYVEADTPEQAEELLWMASEVQLNELLSAITASPAVGGAETVPPKNSGDSATP